MKMNNLVPMKHYDGTETWVAPGNLAEWLRLGYQRMDRLPDPAQELRRYAVPPDPARGVVPPGPHERFRGPCVNGLLAGQRRIGIVLGNGPQIDRLSDEFWCALAAPQYVACGVNRIPFARRPRAAGYAPNLSFVVYGVRSWIYYEDLRRNLERLEGRTWRTASRDVASAVPTDQSFRRRLLLGADLAAGELGMLNVSSDAAAQMLAALGCQKIFLYGIEMNTAQYCAVDSAVAENAHPWRDPGRVDLACRVWGELAHWLAGRLFCACATSELVTRGVVPFGWPEELPIT